jgi:hypothetical protein
MARILKERIRKDCLKCAALVSQGGERATEPLNPF